MADSFVNDDESEQQSEFQTEEVNDFDGPAEEIVNSPPASPDRNSVHSSR